MCNQCNDARRIHTGKIVYGVFHNGRMQMAYSSEVQAIKAKKFMSNGDACDCPPDECEWEVFQVDRKSISWER